MLCAIFKVLLFIVCVHIPFLISLLQTPRKTVREGVEKLMEK